MFLFINKAFPNKFKALNINKKHSTILPSLKKPNLSSADKLHFFEKLKQKSSKSNLEEGFYPRDLGNIYRVLKKSTVKIDNTKINISEPSEQKYSYLKDL